MTNVYYPLTKIKQPRGYFELNETMHILDDRFEFTKNGMEFRLSSRICMVPFHSIQNTLVIACFLSMDNKHLPCISSKEC